MEDPNDQDNIEENYYLKIEIYPLGTDPLPEDTKETESLPEDDSHEENDEN